MLVASSPGAGYHWPSFVGTGADICRSLWTCFCLWVWAQYVTAALGSPLDLENDHGVHDRGSFLCASLRREGITPCRSCDI